MILLLALLACTEVAIYDNVAAPTIRLVQPVEGGRFDPSVPVSVCAAVDYDGDLDALAAQLVSDRDGTLATDGFSACDGGDLGIDVRLQAAPTVLSFTVTDRAGRSATATAAILPIDNAAPSCQILFPADGAVVPLGAPVELTARLDDADGGSLAATITSNLDGELVAEPVDANTTPRFPLTLTAGAHELVLLVEDARGASAACAVSAAVIACQDGDGDGVDACDGDCDDTLASVYPGAPEIADGRDNDCDGVTDEGTALFDDDQDGFTELDGDCDDADAASYPGAPETPDDGVDQDCSGADTVTCAADDDGDGYGGPLAALSAAGRCDLPGLSPNADDCDDTDASIYPGAPEQVADGVDQDCDGVDARDCFVDNDGDTWGSSITVPAGDGDCDDPGEASRSGDCDDTNPAVNPGGVDLPDDGVDQDCSGAPSITCYQDADRDGVGGALTVISVTGVCRADDQQSATTGDCDDQNPNIRPGLAEAPDDGVDQDCSGADTVTCYRDLDGDRYGVAAVLAVDGLCSAARDEAVNPGDCDDQSAARYPGNTELPDDGIDQDCSGGDTVTCYTDQDDDGVGVGAPRLAEATCGALLAAVAGDCDDLNPARFPGNPEVPGDGIDQDCSGSDTVRCYEDLDQDGWGSATGVLAADGSCDLVDRESPINGDCDDDNALVNPDGDDSDPRDGVDADCDGVDGQDADGDGVGNGVDCDDNDPDRYPGAPESRDGRDNDCDGFCDEGLIAAGDLVITEVLVDPAAVSDTTGEWLELYNASAADIQLCDGWSLEDDGADFVDVTGPIVVAPGGYLVVGASLTTNGGAPVDFTYNRNNFSLGNSGDEVVLRFDGLVIDRVVYTGSFAPSGRSKQLSADKTSAALNDLGASWCDSLVAWPGSAGDRGSPGQANAVCP